MADELVRFIPGDTPGTIRSNYDPDFIPQTDSQDRVHLIPTPDDDTALTLTAQVIASYDRELVHAGRKPQTLKTYRKVWKRFEAAFSHLPTDRELILDYLGNFNGPSGRNRLNHQDAIHYLFRHAVAMGWLTYDPMHKMKRPNVQEQAPNPMNLGQVKALLKLGMSLREQAAVHLLAGHGWRANEPLEILAGEVRSIKDNWIWCRGKERQESAPVLPETAELLSRMAVGLADEQWIFRGEGGRDERFG